VGEPTDPYRSLDSNLWHTVGCELDCEIFVTGTANCRPERCRNTSLVGLVCRQLGVKFHRPDTSRFALFQGAERIDHLRVNVGFATSGYSLDVLLVNDFKIEIAHSRFPFSLFVGSSVHQQCKEYTNPNSFTVTLITLSKISLLQVDDGNVTEMLQWNNNVKDCFFDLTLRVGDLTLNMYSIKHTFNVKNSGCLTLSGITLNTRRSFNVKETFNEKPGLREGSLRPGLTFYLTLTSRTGRYLSPVWMHKIKSVLSESLMYC